MHGRETQPHMQAAITRLDKSTCIYRVLRTQTRTGGHVSRFWLESKKDMNKRNTKKAAETNKKTDNHRKIKEEKERRKSINKQKRANKTEHEESFRHK